MDQLHKYIIITLYAVRLKNYIIKTFLGFFLMYMYVLQTHLYLVQSCKLCNHRRTSQNKGRLKAFRVCLADSLIGSYITAASELDIRATSVYSSRRQPTLLSTPPIIIPGSDVPTAGTAEARPAERRECGSAYSGKVDGMNCWALWHAVAEAQAEVKA